MTVSKAEQFLRHPAYGQEEIIANSVKYGFERKGDFISKNQA
jgi:hypothetical protein